MHDSEKTNKKLDLKVQVLSRTNTELTIELEKLRANTLPRTNTDPGSDGDATTSRVAVPPHLHASDHEPSSGVIGPALQSTSADKETAVHNVSQL